MSTIPTKILSQFKSLVLQQSDNMTLTELMSNNRQWKDLEVKCGKIVRVWEIRDLITAIN